MIEDNNPAKVAKTAQRLLDEGNYQMAQVYFELAAEMGTERELWELVAKSYEKSAYCYELDDRMDNASSEYRKAAEAYSKAGLETKSKAAYGLSDSVEQMSCQD